jgi:hypothetical protein
MTSCPRAQAGRLAKEDARRSIEDDYPLRLVMPPREHYTVEAISPASSEGNWFFLLDLWDEEGEADTHLDGELKRIGKDRNVARLDRSLLTTARGSGAGGGAPLARARRRPALVS